MSIPDAVLSTEDAAPAPPRPAHAAVLVTGDPRELARFLHDTIELTDAEIAQVAGVAHEVTVRRWRSRASKSAPRSTEGLDDVRAIVSLLLDSKLVYPAEVGRFLRSRNSDLGYARPLALLGRGEFEKVREAAEKFLERFRNLVLESAHDTVDEQRPEPRTTPARRARRAA